MATAVTYGVKISVESIYRKDLSNAENGLFFFNYRIVIENTNDFDIQLKSRYWFIFDSLNPAREVKGDGVVGEQPILSPGRKHVYVSGCDLHSEIGYMRGYYMFEKTETKETFRVAVPKFDLITVPKLN
ncbi:Co2+/Mg2+ efflux protein ApaG [Paracrocinitomix mangrovi]|uniref:Co2+/Mg2+ efflux protein ApaG n=1 Tax=Paracrocinitomix mangrovi TaxID=2862509 RepID=UPI001C8D8435|nr:Co2+/Mg2+ efflux protein ApaG [Paracrocinitomix mangrovi]UKN02126.1 Co2+/Mg2+ efflux protein ApaG [Paracrocinitomix mangrovi]